MNVREIVYNSSHPDIPLPASETVEIGTAFTAATPQKAEGWTFDGWYTDTGCKTRWVDGTTITGDLNLYGKWHSDGVKDTWVTFEYSSNSEDKSAGLPNNILWQKNTTIYPSQLPHLPIPTSATTTITGWYLDPQAEILVNESGVLVGEGGITLYAKAESSEVVSVSFDYAIGRISADADKNYPMPATIEAAWDAETLGDDSTLPDQLLTGKPGETVELPPATEMKPLFEDTEFEARFKGWFTDPVVQGEPITSIVLGTADTTVYALYEPNTEVEYVDITYKIANVYIPEVKGDGEIVPSDEHIAVKDAIALMPNLACRYIGSNANKYEHEPELADYEWHDFVVKGSKYCLAMPNTATDITDDYQFGGYYSDINCEQELTTVIDELKENMTVYCKFVLKSEKAEDQDDLPETYDISYEFDGFASDTDIPSGGLMPPDIELPAAQEYQPEEIDQEAFPDFIDAFIPPTMPSCEGFEFKGWYYYDANGNKVDFISGEEEVRSKLVLYPEYEMLPLDIETTLTLITLTPNTLGAPEDLDWQDVPKTPFAGIVNPMVMKIGSTLDVSTLVFPELDNTFEVEGFYTLERMHGIYTLKPFTTGKVEKAMSLYVRFAGTIDKPLDVIYENDESTEEAQLLAPDFDYELATSTVTTNGLVYEPRPIDIASRADAGVAATQTIEGYYTDESHTKPFDPKTETQAGETIHVYPKLAQAGDKITVTVDYIPRVYTLSGSQFQFEIPTAPELPLRELSATTYQFAPNTSGATIMAEIGTPPLQKFWKPKNHEYGNCWWYTKAGDANQIPEAFAPDSFKLTEPVILYPQFEADMTYDSSTIERRDDLNLTLSVARSAGAAAAVSSDN